MIHATLALFYYLYFSFVGVLIIFFPKVLSLVGYSQIDVGILLASVPLVRFIAPFVVGGRIPLTRTIFLGALGSVAVASMALYGTLEHFWWLLGVLVLLGFGMSLVLPYVEIMALEHVSRASYGKVRLFGSVGFIVVALLLESRLEEVTRAIDFFVAIAVAMLLVGVAMRNTAHAKSATATTHGRFSMRPFGYLWASLFMMQLAFMPFYSFFTIYETHLGVSLQNTVYLWSAGVLFEIVMLWFQGPLLKRYKAVDLLLFSTFITAVRWAIVYAFGESVTMLYVAQSLHAFSFALYHSVAIRLLYELYVERHQAQQFFSGIAYGLGAFVGSIVAGVIYEYYPSMLFLFASIATLVSTLLLYRERKTICAAMGIISTKKG